MAMFMCVNYLLVAKSSATVQNRLFYFVYFIIIIRLVII